MMDFGNQPKLVAGQVPASPQPEGSGLRLVVMLPALNEAATIGDIIRRVPRDIPAIAQVDILVIDDGSTDRTVEIAREHGAKVVSHSRNMGVGRALKTGLAEALRDGFDIALNMDSDGQFSPEDIPKLVGPIVSGEADLVSASRFKDPALVPDMPRMKLLGNKGMAWLISHLVGERFFDVSCGFRAHSREAMLRLTLMGHFTYTQETFLLLHHYGLRLLEVPIAVRGVREHGESRVASNLLSYAIRASRIILAFLRDYRPSLFFSVIGHVLMVPGSILALFFFGHRLLTGAFTPHLWAGFLSAYLMGTAVLLYVFGQLAAMLGRLRMLQEESLYHQRRADMGRAKEDRVGPDRFRRDLASGS